jgi:tetratricopeptide (TPR) repeat protein
VAGTTVDDLPTTVEAAIAARIDALDAPRRGQLGAASVLGQRFPAVRLACVLGDTGADPSRTLAAFLEHEEGGWVRFRHSLVREGAHALLPPRERRQLHAVVGEVLETDGAAGCTRAEPLSHHFAAAQRWQPALRWSLRAAERSASAGAHAEAARFLRGALAAASHLELEPAELSRLYEQLADAEELTGDADAATDALTRARRLADDPVRIAHLLHRHGRVSDGAGNLVAAQRWFARGLRELADAPPTAGAERARLDLIISQAATKIRQGRLKEAVPLLESAAVDADVAGHRDALARACSLLSTVLHDLGRTEEASQHLDRAAPIFEELADLVGQAAAHRGRGDEAFHDGDRDMAAARWRRAATLYEQAGDLVNQAMVRSHLVEVAADRAAVPRGSAPLPIH